MRVMTSIRALLLLIALGTVSCAERKLDPVNMDHGMSEMQTERQDYKSAPVPEAGHAGHTMGAAAMDGPWSYMGRTNPKPFREMRWEMVPVPGYGHLYLNSGKLSQELICEALRDNPRVMVDRTTRKACGMPELPPTAAVDRMALPETPAARKPLEHEHHAGMEMRQEERGGMSEHWMAPDEAAKRRNPVPADRTSIERGEKLYRTHCAACHGPQGRGDGPAAAALTPRPPDLGVMGGQHPPGDLAWKIENGRGPMPAWKAVLPERDIWDLVNFIRNLKTPDHKQTPKEHHHEDPGRAH